MDYIKGLRTYEDSINTCFGSAIHEALQCYLKALYTQGAEIADSLDVKQIFVDDFNKELLKLKKEDGTLLYSEEQYKEFLYNGDDIISTFLNSANRLKYFPRNKYEFIGIELPLEMEIRNNVLFVAFIDLILKEKDTGKYKIFDFKTSSNGWNKYQKEDPSKIAQLLLYKAFYSKQFDVPLDKIEVEFFILKRNLYENCSFPQSRIQPFAPTQNKPAVTKTLNDFIEFLDQCFNEDGNYKLDGYYPKNPGKAKKNCKYCKYYKTEHCDGKEEKD